MAMAQAKPSSTDNVKRRYHHGINNGNDKINYLRGEKENTNTQRPQASMVDQPIKNEQLHNVHMQEEEQQDELKNNDFSSDPSSSWIGRVIIPSSSTSKMYQSYNKTIANDTWLPPPPASHLNKNVKHNILLRTRIISNSQNKNQFVAAGFNGGNAGLVEGAVGSGIDADCDTTISTIPSIILYKQLSLALNEQRVMGGGEGFFPDDQCDGAVDDGKGSIGNIRSPYKWQMAGVLSENFTSSTSAKNNTSNSRNENAKKLNSTYAGTGIPKKMRPVVILLMDVTCHTFELLEIHLDWENSMVCDLVKDVEVAIEARAEQVYNGRMARGAEGVNDEKDESGKNIFHIADNSENDCPILTKINIDSRIGVSGQQSQCQLIEGYKRKASVSFEQGQNANFEEREDDDPQQQQLTALESFHMNNVLVISEDDSDQGGSIPKIELTLDQFQRLDVYHRTQCHNETKDKNQDKMRDHHHISSNNDGNCEKEGENSTIATSSALENALQLQPPILLSPRMKTWPTQYDGLIQCRSLPESNPIVMIHCFGLKRYEVMDYEIFLAKPCYLSAKETSTYAESLLTQLSESGMIRRNNPLTAGSKEEDCIKSPDVLTTLSPLARSRILNETFRNNCYDGVQRREHANISTRFLTFSSAFRTQIKLLQKGTECLQVKSTQITPVEAGGRERKDVSRLQGKEKNPHDNVENKSPPHPTGQRPELTRNKVARHSPLNPALRQQQVLDNNITPPRNNSSSININTCLEKKMLMSPLLSSEMEDLPSSPSFCVEVKCEDYILARRDHFCDAPINRNNDDSFSFDDEEQEISEHNKENYSLPPSEYSKADHDNDNFGLVHPNDHNCFPEIFRANPTFNHSVMQKTKPFAIEPCSFDAATSRNQNKEELGSFGAAIRLSQSMGTYHHSNRVTKNNVSTELEEERSFQQMMANDYSPNSRHRKKHILRPIRTIGALAKKMSPIKLLGGGAGSSGRRYSKFGDDFSVFTKTTLADE